MITKITFVTIKCDGPDCEREATFQADQESEKDATRQNPWIAAVRNVGTLDNRTFTYCSDECEIKGAAEGRHNKEERRVISAASPQQIDLAAKAAEAARKANKALHDGASVTLG
ncbi:MAG TPA: hypothetical protein VFA52_04345 [Candidatus Paceibacterota bacterium]|jgi:hypothetical protein|nr:hypothetical protein [Candidatus Paceibacterota bacterium]